MSEHQCDFKLVPIKMTHFIEVFSAKFYDFKSFPKIFKMKNVDIHIKVSRIKISGDSNSYPQIFLI